MKSAALLLLSLALAGCRPPAARLEQDAYVWQRAWTPQVRAALVESGAADLRSFAVLAAEVNVAVSPPKIVRPAVDFAALAATGKPIALAIRVDPFSGPFRADSAELKTIVATARERLDAARQQGVPPIEVQIDFDCAEAKLDGYRIWLATLRQELAVPVCPTVLPSWLKHPEFATLARESGRFVLQVHSVAPPRRIENAQKLTDPALASEWVRQAGKLGVPFRVALPTYAYLVAFDARGNALGISAEGPSSRWPAEARVVRWEADPAEIAGLIAQWNRARPATMTGVIWYRLPVAGDALNWRWPTLAAAMQGRVPASSLRLEASDAQPAEILAINDGERDEPLPAALEARWEGAQFIAADALDGYTFAQPAPGLVRFTRQSAAALSRLPPGARRPIGWLRCEPPAPIHLSPAPAVPVSSSGPARDGF